MDFLRRLFEQATPPPATAESLESAIHTTTSEALAVHDIRKIANPWRVDRKGKRWSVRGKRRTWSEIDRVTFHQTACVLGERPARYATLGAHYGIPASGSLIHVYDEELLIWHANNLSQRSIGIEIDGRFFGRIGDMSTIWDDPSTRVRELPTELTEAQIATSLDLGRTAARRIIANGGTFRGFYCHRQSSVDRRNDPGAEPYQRIVRVLNDEFGVDAGGLNWKVGDGRAIPSDWDERSEAKY